MSATETSPRFETDVGPLVREAVENGSMPCEGQWPGESVAVLRSWLAFGKAP